MRLAVPWTYIELFVNVIESLLGSNPGATPSRSYVLSSQDKLL